MMMNGSIVCPSADDFDQFYVATVSGRRIPEKLAVGEFQIRLENSFVDTSLTETTPDTNFVMVESKVFFEVY